ncbi:hypothetical protein E2562_028077 [Oryza meyeriana var. granulata]|uniref:Uncharacterized protein n=1 Tax=Oryza meyeriana var. granulata TaxID=110450 RepID=A0A6G1C0F4_9ORYZ|nr:hypothetical protein E2562_028077 [Oryza meyeriana var. granulata]
MEGRGATTVGLSRAGGVVAGWIWRFLGRIRRPFGERGRGSFGEGAVGGGAARGLMAACAEATPWQAVVAGD